MSTANVNDLFAALKTKWDATASLGSATPAFNGPYFQRKPPDTSAGFPYVIFRHVGTSHEGTTNESAYFLDVVEFTVYNTTPELVGANLGTIRNTFNHEYLPSLAVGKGSIVKAREAGQRVEEENSNVAKATLTLEYTRQVAR